MSPARSATTPSSRRSLASFADVYVNDAFGTAHRAHASTTGRRADLPAVAGFLMEREIDYLGRIVSDPEPPVAAIIGGAKISSKIAVLEHLLSKVSTLLIGGGMASTFPEGSRHRRWLVTRGVDQLASGAAGSSRKPGRAA